ncbi:MAG TPA: DNA repair protein RadA [bacterium]|nr:DNA repair protein RadA [bacterium]HQG45260.1 DNA repair protein RadA [bacterium]HQJ65561.1 DNA repair protein RadA [bacterium]
MNKSRKDKVHFVCQNCGTVSPRWLGKCPGCEAWNSFIEERAPAHYPRAAQSVPASRNQALPLEQISTDLMPRLQTVSPEFNRVLGGGIVMGSVVLIGGDPGIGKSTLMLQEAAGLGCSDFRVLYVTGEESAQQTKMRAQRLGLVSEGLYVLAETEIESVGDAIAQIAPRLVVVDSIQTMYTPMFESAPGSVSQVRECTLRLIQVAKSEHIPVFLVGHVTKEGMLAGPKVLEHMVDALLLFEGDRDHFYRILRASKNRFGSTREIGVFEMTEGGLRDVPNPSAVFLSERRAENSGSAVICCMEGTRPILLEVQALVSSANYGLPQRTTTGLDIKRVQMLLAVLDKRLGYHVGTMDVFVNAVGGFRIDETAADIGIVACIASSMRNRVIDPEAILLGEVGLGGELRSVAHVDARLAEAEKMGFRHAVIPRGNKKSLPAQLGMHIFAVSQAQEALDAVLQ